MVEYARTELKDNAHGVNQTDLFKVLFGDIVREARKERQLVRFKRSENDPNNPSNPDMNELKNATEFIKKSLIDGKDAAMFFDLMKTYLRLKMNEEPDMAMIKEAQKSASASYGFCNAIVNQLRNILEEMKCAHNHTNTGPFAVIFAALFLLGIGRTMPWSLGVPLIDDNVKRKNLPVYFAGMFFIRILGPILGFTIGSFCNRLYYTLETPVGLSPRDPTWIGAWWLGFFVIAAVMAGPSLALFLFPNPVKKSTPLPIGVDGEDLYVIAKTKRTLTLVDKHVKKSENGETFVPEKLVDKLKDFKKSVISVLRSPIYSGSLCGRVLDVLAFKGFMVFLPKYLENHYGIPQYEVQMYLVSH